MSETESGFQDAVIDLAKWCGWELRYHTHDSRRSDAGFPDLVMLKPPRIIVAELKTDKGRVSKTQQAWLDGWRACVPLCAALQVFVWRPADWPEIERQLKSRWPLVKHG